MGKHSRAPLEVVEEWTPIDPSDPQALAQEGQKLRLLISILLKAHDRTLLEQSEKADQENERIRRKAGLAV